MRHAGILVLLATCLVGCPRPDDGRTSADTGAPAKQDSKDVKKEPSSTTGSEGTTTAAPEVTSHP